MIFTFICWTDKLCRVANCIKVFTDNIFAVVGECFIIVFLCGALPTKWTVYYSLPFLTVYFLFPTKFIMLFEMRNLRKLTGRFLECVNMCSCNEDLKEELTPQISQCKCFSPVWVFMWVSLQYVYTCAVWVMIFGNI